MFVWVNKITDYDSLVIGSCKVPIYHQVAVMECEMMKSTFACLLYFSTFLFFANYSTFILLHLFNDFRDSQRVHQDDWDHI